MRDLKLGILVYARKIGLGKVVRRMLALVI